MKILVVCLGNTCRSPMAGGLLRKISDEHGLSLEVQTAGLTPHPNRLVAEKAVLAVQELGIDISAEYSKPVTEDAIAWADFIVTVERAHAEYLLEDYPDAAQKICFLESDVPDPFNGTLEDYRRTRDQLHALLLRLVSSLKPD